MSIHRAALSGVVCAAALVSAASAAEPTVYQVKPSEADPAVAQFDEPNLIFRPREAGARTPLVLFLSGTGGRPAGGRVLLETVAAQGYPAISLAYNDVPAVVQVCPRDPDPACSSDFRRMRVFGDGPSKAVSNSRAESIQARLAALLVKLEKDHPGEGWGGYLKGGAPDWSRIVVSGLSQGAGMAAWIARQTPVARVVLFSSPWDFTAPGPKLAPWIDGPGATPPDRWYAAYNSRENTAALLAESYRRLGVPADHIRVFSRDLPPDAKADGPNPYHPIGIRDEHYADDWRFLYGKPD
ncbi:hypothetical protein [uncultured Caulobacter sp.]|uniref:BPSS1187 family protein n=1 Tax=uncultured Caulobacter sp. TaxID=158749 RepID=UPI00262707AE|nr:hypothetical protein [uncultured Caulobacter sp.]